MYFGVSTGAVLEFDGVTWRKIFLASSVVRSLAMDEVERFGWVRTRISATWRRTRQGRFSIPPFWTKYPSRIAVSRTCGRRSALPRVSSFDPTSGCFVGMASACRSGAPQKDHGSRLFQQYVVTFTPTRKESASRKLSETSFVRRPEEMPIRTQSSSFSTHTMNLASLFRLGISSSLYMTAKTVTPFVTEADEYLKKNKLYTTVPLNNGSFCITSLSGGAIIIEHDGKLRQIIDVAAGLPTSDILSAFVDHEGSLWLGHDEGVARVALDSPISVFLKAPSWTSSSFKVRSMRSTGGGGAAVSKLVIDPATRHTRLIPLKALLKRGLCLTSKILLIRILNSCSRPQARVSCEWRVTNLFPRCRNSTA